MDERSQKKLDSILAKDINDIQPHDITFLRARSAYLTDEQRELYLKEEKKETKEIPYNELLQMARDKGFHIPTRIPRQDIEALLNQ